MKLYSNESIVEGDYYPSAWVWHGDILPLSKSAPVGWALRIRLPWWIRRHSPWLRTEVLHQLMFGVIHFSGSPERYEFWFTPVEDE